MATTEHFMPTDIEWDPIGRYLVIGGKLSYIFTLFLNFGFLVIIRNLVIYFKCCASLGMFLSKIYSSLVPGGL